MKLKILLLYLLQLQCYVCIYKHLGICFCEKEIFSKINLGTLVLWPVWQPVTIKSLPLTNSLIIFLLASVNFGRLKWPERIVLLLFQDSKMELKFLSSSSLNFRFVYLFANTGVRLLRNLWLFEPFPKRIFISCIQLC